MAASTDGVSHCRDNRGDGGAIEALCTFDDSALAEISKGHNNDVGAIRTSPAVEDGGGKERSFGPWAQGIVNSLQQG